MKKTYSRPQIEAVSMIATNSLLDTSVVGVDYTPISSSSQGGISVGGN